LGVVGFVDVGLNPAIIGIIFGIGRLWALKRAAVNIIGDAEWIVLLAERKGRKLKGNKLA
ncbi:hypothetical protein ACEE78_12280, partial [Staphylococcus hyicus]